MINEEKLHFRRGDAVAIAAVLVFAAALLLVLVFSRPAEKMSIAKVYQDGALLCELPLDRDAEYVVEGAYRNVITVKNSAVAITESNCPGGDCMHTGAISAGGKSIVCLPNRVEILLSGESDVDAFTQ